MITWSRSRPTARKKHRCEVCGRAILPGETYMRGAGFGDGEAHTFKECAHCDVYVQLVTRRFGEDEYLAEHIADWDEPKTIAEARVRAQFRRRWTNRAGDLYPVPVGVTTTDPHGFGWPSTFRPGEVVRS